jgi:hypothetical protein
MSVKNKLTICDNKTNFFKMKFVYQRFIQKFFYKKFIYQMNAKHDSIYICHAKLRLMPDTLRNNAMLIFCT